MSRVPLWLTGGRAIEVREANDVIDQMVRAASTLRFPVFVRSAWHGVRKALPLVWSRCNVPNTEIDHPVRLQPTT
jgi:hypothetical protein